MGGRLGPGCSPVAPRPRLLRDSSPCPTPGQCPRRRSPTSYPDLRPPPGTYVAPHSTYVKAHRCNFIVDFLSLDAQAAPATMSAEVAVDRPPDPEADRSVEGLSRATHTQPSERFAHLTTAARRDR